MPKEKTTQVEETPISDSILNGARKLATAYIDATEKALVSGVNLLKFAAQEKLPMKTLLDLFKLHPSWPVDEKLVKVGMDKAASSKAGRAYGALRKAAQRYEGEGSGGEFIAKLDGDGFLILKTVEKASSKPVDGQTATGEGAGKGADDKAPAIGPKELATATADASAKARHTVLLAISAEINALRPMAKSEDAVAIIEKMLAVVNNWQSLK